MKIPEYCAKEPEVGKEPLKGFNVMIGTIRVKFCNNLLGPCEG